MKSWPAWAILLLPPVLFAAHVAEELPGYVEWFNRIATPPIPSNGFLDAQLTPLIEASVLGGLAAWTRARWAVLLLLVWCTHFFLVNGLFHLLASVALWTYSPGLITGVLLYLPFSAWLARYAMGLGVPQWLVGFVIGLAGWPAAIQAYRVVFTGKRFY